MSASNTTSTNNQPVTTKLFMVSFKGDKLNKEWLKEIFYDLNNELTIPCKLIKIVEEEIEPANDKDEPRYQYYAEVEECLDIKEWKKLNNAFIIGVHRGAKLSQNIIRKW